MSGERFEDEVRRMSAALGTSAVGGDAGLRWCLHDYLEDRALALATVVERLRARVAKGHPHRSRCLAYLYAGEGYACTCGLADDAAALNALDGVP